MLALLLWLPVLIFAAGVIVARVAGCGATEAGPEPCMVTGVDIGHGLYTMTMMGWVVAFLSPLLLASLVAIVVLLARQVLRRRSAARLHRRNDP